MNKTTDLFTQFLKMFSPVHHHLPLSVSSTHTLTNIHTHIRTLHKNVIIQTKTDLVQVLLKLSSVIFMKIIFLKDPALVST